MPRAMFPVGDNIGVFRKLVDPLRGTENIVRFGVVDLAMFKNRGFGTTFIVSDRRGSRADECSGKTKKGVTIAGEPQPRFASRKLGVGSVVVRSRFELGRDVEQFVVVHEKS